MGVGGHWFRIYLKKKQTVFLLLPWIRLDNSCPIHPSIPLPQVDNPMHLLDVGQEAIVLSGLNKHASESLKNIKNLYDETKYLKTYLEKLEAKVKDNLWLYVSKEKSRTFQRRCTTTLRCGERQRCVLLGGEEFSSLVLSSLRGVSCGNNRYSYCSYSQYWDFPFFCVILHFAEPKFVLQVLDVSNGGVLLGGRCCSPGQRFPFYHSISIQILFGSSTTFCKQSQIAFFQFLFPQFFAQQLPFFLILLIFFQFFTAEDRAQRVVLQ